MTNRIALILGAFIIAAIALDVVLGTGGTIFVAQKFLGLINAAAFWR